MDLKIEVIDFKARRKEIAELKNNGLSAVEIAKKYNISRQAVYQLLKKAKRDGIKVNYKGQEKKINVCVICKKSFHGTTRVKTCSSICKENLFKQKVIIKDSKWSRSLFVEYTCFACNNIFKRSKYLDSISRVRCNSEHKKYYCSKECYYNRNS